MNTFSKKMTALVAIGTVCGCLAFTSSAHAQKTLPVIRPVTYRVLPTAALIAPTRIVPVVPYVYGPTLYTPSLYTPSTLYPVTTLPAPIRTFNVYSRTNPFDIWSLQGSYPSYASALQAVTSLEYSGFEAFIR